MFKLLKLFLVLLLSLSFVGCSSLGWLKFWGDEDEEIELPAVLEEINQELILDIELFRLVSTLSFQDCEVIRKS